MVKYFWASWHEAKNTVSILILIQKEAGRRQVKTMWDEHTWRAQCASL